MSEKPQVGSLQESTKLTTLWLDQEIKRKDTTIQNQEGKSN